ncbi:MAG: peptidoglycan-binding protein [Chthoniobacter sp.]|nr:peptidoglycan-binding protein [Chthoniobacter sp.]
MKNLARFSSLAAALCLGLPATGFSHDHGHGSWSGGHGGSHGYYYGSHYGYYHGAHYGYYRPYPFFAAYPYYAAPYYYDNSYYDGGYYDGPSVGLSISPSATYRGTRADDRADDLTIDVQRALRRGGYYRGSIDGDLGAGTRGAIRQYQYDHHLEVTGRIDRSLLRSLELD